MARFHFHGPLFYYQSRAVVTLSRSGPPFSPGEGVHYSNHDLEDNNQIENRFASNDRRPVLLLTALFLISSLKTSFFTLQFCRIIIILCQLSQRQNLSKRGER